MYQALEKPRDAIELELINDFNEGFKIHWKESLPKDLIKGTKTWVDLKKNNNNYYYFIEDNRWGVNFPMEHFKIISESEKDTKNFKVGDWVLTSNAAGGWGSLPNQINNKILQITKIDLEKENSNKDKFWFDNLVTIRYEIVRKALPHEIPKKEDSLLEEAKRRYPEGTKFYVVNKDYPNGNRKYIGWVEGELIWWTNSFYNLGDAITSKPGSGILYYKGKWAEIVTEDQPEVQMFPKDSYVVLLRSVSENPNCWKSSMPINYCYQLKKDSYLDERGLVVYKDASSDNRENGWSLSFPYKDPMFEMRLATKEEEEHYKKLGKPYPISELKKEEKSYEELLEIAKKKYPIGMVVTSLINSKHKEKVISYNRRNISSSNKLWIEGENHNLLVYKDGKWASTHGFPLEDMDKLPKEWFIKIKDEYRKELNDWKIKQIYNDSLINDPHDYKYVTNLGSGAVNMPENSKEITFEQFKKLVLKKSVDKECETCNGSGQVIVGKLYPNGHTEINETCPDCEGVGFFSPVDSKPQFEVGRWYKVNWKRSSTPIYIKPTSISNDNIFCDGPTSIWEDYYDGIYRDGGYAINELEIINPLTKSEMQKYLPEGHPDKVSNKDSKLITYQHSDFPKDISYVILELKEDISGFIKGLKQIPSNFNNGAKTWTRLSDWEDTSSDIIPENNRYSINFPKSYFKEINRILIDKPEEKVEDDLSLQELKKEFVELLITPLPEIKLTTFPVDCKKDVSIPGHLDLSENGKGFQPLMPIIADKSNIEIGTKVVRGKDWVWGEQDGGEGNIGVVQKEEDYIPLDKSCLWVKVLWEENDYALSYRVGYNNKYDLYLASEQQQKTIKDKGVSSCLEVELIKLK